MPNIQFNILNQLQTPAFYASSLATRPAFGFAGRIFIDTDSPSTGIYRDTGSAWVAVADPGAGTTGTLQQVTVNGNTTTLGINLGGRCNVGGAADNPVYALNVNGGKTLLGGDLYCFSRASVGNSNTTAATLYLQSNDGSIPVIRSQAFATENLFEGRSASATLTSWIDPTGSLTLINQLKTSGTGYVYSGFSVGSTNVSAASLYIQSNNAGIPVVRFQCAGSEDIFNGRNSSGTLVSQISSDGNVLFAGTLGIGGSSDNVKGSTYSPTVTNNAGTSALSASQVVYLRIGNRVQVGMMVSLTPTSTGTLSFTVSLPFSMSVVNQILSGIATTLENTTGRIVYNSGTTAIIYYSQLAVIPNQVYLQFSYSIV